MIGAPRSPPNHASRPPGAPRRGSHGGRPETLSGPNATCSKGARELADRRRGSELTLADHLAEQFQRDGEGGYIFQAVSGDPANARATENDLLRASNLPFHAEGDAATAYLHVPASQVRAFAAAMSEANVIAYKEAHR